MLLGRQLFIEIAHEGDADAFGIHAPRFAVRSLHLLDPPWRLLDLTVTLAEGAIVYQEMIPQSVPETSIMMCSVDEYGVSNIGCRVMDDNVFPFGAWIQSDYVAQGLGVRDDQFLTNFDGIPRP